MSPKGMPRAHLLVFTMLLLGTPVRVSAQEQPSAAAAFKSGIELAAAGDHRSAARRFDAAHRLKPHEAALWNAAREWERAGETAQAANRYREYLASFPTARDAAAAMQALRALEPQLGRIELVRGWPEDVAVDGVPATTAEIYASPGEHVVSAKRASGLISVRVSVVATQRVRAEAPAEAPLVVAPVVAPAPPPPAPTPAPAAPASPASPAPAEAPTPARSGWSPVVVYVGGGVTAVLGAVSIWSGLNTNGFKRNTFDADPSKENYESGLAREHRTNALLGTTIGLGVITGLVAFFLVDWRKEPSRGARTFVAPDGIRGTF